MALRPLRIGNSWGRAATAAMAHPLRQVLTQIGAFTARPTAFLIVGIYAVLWLLLDRESLNWHGVATLATWLMTLFIQRAEHRDTQALQAKLDELLRVHGGAKKKVKHVG